MPRSRGHAAPPTAVNSRARCHQQRGRRNLTRAAFRGAPANFAAGRER
eukprot:CAMPEP_0170425782 /NCGR_PEP_ID=MMETSP0117_2-20130122/38290_1 /TAXON_ID=400756 /ORGANISM="Durinskia baltica, Strain CSIRO CS-38" /LENGTH=47 /DNA_ID= /DNA_START= /DNA_END= /DNA_ORIENTATION=